LGDIIIFSSFLDLLKKEVPNSKIYLAIRSVYLPVSKLFSGIECIFVDLPYSGEYNEESLNSFLDTLSRISFHQIIYSTHNCTWIEKEIQKKFPKIQSYSISPYFHSFENIQTVEVEEKESEWSKYNKLSSKIFPNSTLKYHYPKVDESIFTKIDIESLLSSLELRPKEFICWNPSGIANFTAKNWSIENHISLIKFYMKNYNLKVLLIGSDHEREILKSIHSTLPGRFQDRVRMFTNPSENSLLMTSVLIHFAKLFIGNDTGTTHLAAALSTPVFSFYGGGTWPRFIPLTSQKLIITNQIHCYGCNWNCNQGSIVCLDSIPFIQVQKYFKVFVDQEGKMDEIVNLKLTPKRKHKINWIDKVKSYILK